MPQTAFYTPVSSRIRPAITAITYNTAIIFIFSFLSGFTLNNTTSPIPAPVQSPAITEEKEIAPLRYSCVRITDAAQFGIRPIKAAIAGWNTVSPSIIAEILSIPSMSIHRFKINVNTNKSFPYGEVQVLLFQPNDCDIHSHDRVLLLDAALQFLF